MRQKPNMEVSSFSLACEKSNCATFGVIIIIHVSRVSGGLDSVWCFTVYWWSTMTIIVQIEALHLARLMWCKKSPLVNIELDAPNMRVLVP